ncbi:hypothetical protein ETAA1_31620 [Urbifossiella limnaea]|uniref:Core-binding (CB) domain-containing protein n=1 Tax=Urbifossiella limnaea TaxID=2528023 RepID=A0A517XUK8_9BACT|nr:hypothetical protein ETAA1_31620 [Urbifossiella limnaea]
MRRYSLRTEDAYHDWVRRFVLFHGKRHPETMGEREVNAFLTHLAVEGRVAASTQNQALAALLFLYTSTCWSGRSTGSATSCGRSGRGGSRWC